MHPNNTQKHLNLLGLTGGDFMPGMLNDDAIPSNGGGLMMRNEQPGALIPPPIDAMGGNGILDLLGGSLEDTLFKTILGGGIITLSSNDKSGGAIRLPSEYFGIQSDNYHAHGGNGESSVMPYESPGYQYCGSVGGAQRGVFKMKDLHRLSKKHKMDLPKDKTSKIFILSKMNAYLKNILHSAKKMSKSGKITRTNLNKIMKKK
jgi:hypothetical protein